jgi:Tol biopolymer transport system component
MAQSSPISRLSYAIALLLLVVAIGIGVASGAARLSGSTGAVRNAKIAFSEPDAVGPYGTSPPSNLYVIDSDGSNKRLLAPCGPRLCFLRAFAWSPDGRRLAFLRGPLGGVPVPTDFALHLIDADGSNERRLDGCGKPRWPSCGDFNGSQIAWSPNGDQLVVPRERSLYVFDVDRGTFRRLTSCGARPCFDKHPAWAPNGRRVIFVRYRSPYTESLYTVRPDGSGLRRLTEKLPGAAANPAWSPDGRRIAFDVSDGVDARLYVMAADGSDHRVLRRGAGATGPGVPAWSPNGRQIAYLTTPELTSRFRAAIWVVNRDGTGRRLLYRSACCIESWGRPAWSPDAGSIVFGVGLRGDPARSGIFVIKSNGTGLRRVASAPTEAAWQPIR